MEGQPTDTKGNIMSKAKTNEPKKDEVQKPEGENQDLFADINVTMKSGHLVKDAEVIAEGKYAKFRIAGNKQYMADGEIKTITNYFNVMVSSNLTDAFETAQEFKKGDWVYAKGEDSTKSFDTPQGYKQTASTIFAYEVFLKKPKEDEAGQASDAKPKASSAPKKEHQPAMS
ncbi:MAG: hypothetical protein CMB80_25935 [Flammeovirgaceae bacterium]|nr:hypothetical protein [Flammeovirgaceae bacterium]